MEASNDVKLSSLIEMIKEDRIEIREIRRRLYSTMQYFLIASLAIVGFGKDKVHLESETLSFVILTFLFISWVYFIFTKRDLNMVRKCLEKRQKQCVSDFNYDFFPNCNDIKPEIKDNEFYYVIVIVSIIYLCMLIAVKCCS